MNSNLINEIFNFILEKIKILITFVVIGIVISLVYCSLFIPPKYKATATAVISLNENYVENATQSLISTQSQLTSALIGYFDEDYIFDLLYKNQPEGLSKKYSKSELKGMFTTTSFEDTFVLKTTAVAYNAKDASLLCNAYVTQALNHTMKLIDVGYWDMVESAKTPASSFYPNKLKVAFIGAAVGGALFCLIAFLVIIFNDRILSKRDLEEIFPEVPVLSEVAKIAEKDD